EHTAKVEQSARAADYHALEPEFARAYERRRAAATTMATATGPEHDAAREQFRAANVEMSGIRTRAALIVKDVMKDVTGVANYGDKTGDTPKPDVNYVFPTFVTTR